MINSASERLRPYLNLPSPMEYCSWLSDRTKARVYLKLETFRETRTFKVRGALNFVLQLSYRERQQGVVTASGGNHALAVSYAAHLVGSPCIVIMTTKAPANVADMCRAYNAVVVIQGDFYEESEEIARHIAEDRNLNFIPAFDHEAIIAGQGTIASELVKQKPELTDVIVPVGGGGLIAGISAFYKSKQLSTRVIGVEPNGGSALFQSLKRGERMKLPYPASRWAEKLIPQSIGRLPFEVAKECVDEVLLADDEAIESAVCDFLGYSSLLVEGSAAITAAALMSNQSQFVGRQVVLVITGANVNLPLLREALQKVSGCSSST